MNLKYISLLNKIFKNNFLKIALIYRKHYIAVYCLLLLIFGFCTISILQVNAINGLTATVAPNPLCNITRDLRIGMTGDDIKELQKYLNNNDYPLAQTGFGSKGNETTYFGPLTKSTLTKFQKENNIVTTYGIFNLDTKNYLGCKESVVLLPNPSSSTPPPATVFQFTRDLTIAMTGNDVKELQQYLNNNGFPLAQSGVGSKGDETTYFGSLTKSALIKFQIANNINPSVGYFGQLTRDLANNLINESNTKAKVVLGEVTNNNQNNEPSGTGNGSSQSNGTSGTGNEGSQKNGQPDVINETKYYSIGGSITGLAGPVTMQNNGRDDITINPGDNSNFTFPTAIANNTNYNVIAISKYTGQTCYLSNNTGVVNGADVTNIIIACGLNINYNPITSPVINSGGSVTTYSLTYTASTNGSISGTASQTVNSGSSGSAVTAVPDTGYSFVSWSDLSSSNPRTDTNVTADKSVIATFSINTYTVNFNSNNGTTEANPISTTTDYNTTIILPTAPAKTGYTFNSWDTLANGTGSTFDASTAVIASTTVYAKWTANNNTITFDGNTSTGGSTSAQTIATDASANLTANGFTKTGYTFAGWATTSGGAVAYADTASYTMGTASITLYAKWTANNNTITFDGNTNTGGSTSAQTIATDASANLTANGFTKTGYTFAGWATTSGGAVAYADTASYTMGTASLTLYAKWTASDNTPDLFTYTDQTLAPLSTLTESNILQITGINLSTAVSTSGDGTPNFRICSDSGCSSVTHDWSASAGTIDNNEYLQIRLTSSAVDSTANSVSITVGTGSDSWSVTTKDDSPAGLSFNDQTNVAINTLTLSNITQITSLTGSTTVSISGDGTPNYRICADSGCGSIAHDWTSSAGTIDNNEYLQVRLTSSASNITSRSASITVGTGSDSWTVTTSLFVMDYFEYATNGAAQAGYVTSATTDIPVDDIGTHTVTNPNNRASISIAQHSSYNSSDSSVYFTSVADNVFGLTVPNHPDFDFGTGDFTIDFFWYFTGTIENNQGWTAYSLTSPTTQLYFSHEREGVSDYKWRFYTPSKATIKVIATINNNTWYHVAMTRTGTTFRVFVNGINIHSSTDAGDIESGAINIFSGTTATAGYIDNFRVAKGTGLWTSNFSLNDTELLYTGGAANFGDLFISGSQGNYDLNSASEPSIKTQGSYALKLSATTDALNESVTKSLRPTGGTITTDGDYTIHTFTESGTMYFPNSGEVEYLVVGGGGGGYEGGDSWNGGGGAGGFLTATGLAVTATEYPVIVGAGGSANSSGSNSSFNSIVAIGGGHGASRRDPGVAAASGGSGGGGAETTYTVAGAGTDGQGFAGGTGGSAQGAGGGGAGAVGTDSPNGTGGVGLASSITGSLVYYAGGGGGGGVGAAGGNGGGGAGCNSGTSTNGVSGTANTGGGGGGSGNLLAGGAGGSGIVVIRYLTADFPDNSIDLTGKNTIRFDARATATGANLQAQLHETGNTTTVEVAQALSSVGTWSGDGALANYTYTPNSTSATVSIDFNCWWQKGTQNGDWTGKIVLNGVTIFESGGTLDNSSQTYTTKHFMTGQSSYNVQVTSYVANNKLTYAHDIFIEEYIGHDINITSADTFQEEVWDISGVPDADKDVIDSIRFEVIGAGSAIDYYIDNMIAEETDTGPNSFVFTDQTDVALSTLISSNILQISGMDDGTSVSISGDGTPAYRICSASDCGTVTHDWTTSEGLIDNNEYLQLRLTSSASEATANSVSITVGTGSDSWSVTTANFNYFGDGSDGAVTISADTQLTVPNKNGSYDGDMVVKNYSSLTIDEGYTLTTDQPGRGMIIYVSGNATINGTLSMTARGAAANPTVAGASDSSAVSATGIRLPVFKSGETDTLAAADFAGTGNGAVAAVANQNGISGNGKIYTIARTGAIGGVTPSNQHSAGVAGSDGVSNQSGGGGSGTAYYNTFPVTAGAGATGTCFSGGPGGGGAQSHANNGAAYGGNGTAYGGAGGAGDVGNLNEVSGAGGGAGNPGGLKENVGGYPAFNGDAGTGGLLILLVGGDLTIGSSGVISANGADGGDSDQSPGGASGGGNLLVLYSGTLSNSGNITATGGVGGYHSSKPGGDGGDGSVQGPTQINP